MEEVETPEKMRLFRKDEKRGESEKWLNIIIGIERKKETKK